jgi:DUF4097 and DUF4098 domain-containing protein YvlB
MPTFDTPEPIAVDVELGAGDVRIVASDRADTVVEVRPSDPNKKAHVAAAQQTRVDFASGRLTVRGPRGGWRQFSFRGGNESVDVEIAVPAGSQLRYEAGMADLHCAGRLGECRVKSGAGRIEIDQAGPIRFKIGAGDITVHEATGHTEVTSGSGALHIGTIDGTAVIRNANGETSIGTVTGDLRIQAANGRIAVDRADATVAAKSANGAIRIGEVARGAVVAETANGGVEIGVRDGVAAWLDLDTRFGKVRNNLDPAGQPGAGEPTVDVRAHSAFGDITIHRAPAVTPAEERA